MLRRESSPMMGWLAVVLVCVVGYASWLVPPEWYPYREWVAIPLMVALCGAAGWSAWRNRSMALGVAAVVAFFSPLIVIVLGLLLWGV